MTIRKIPKGFIVFFFSAIALYLSSKASGAAFQLEKDSTPIYIRSKPIEYRNKHDLKIKDLSIDVQGASATCINLINCRNMHITRCRLVNSSSYAINLYNCSNITVDSCYIANVGFGVYAVNGCSSIKVNANQLLNINGINTSLLGHAIQFNGVSGGGNQINNNRIENIDGQAVHPHDQINVFKSNGLPGDSIQVIGNWVRGGQTALWPTSGSGAAGIVVGDVGGSYQVCRNNIVVNGGRIGIQAQGGTHIKVDHNQIYGRSMPITQVGLAWGNWSGVSTSDVEYSYNKVRWYNFDGSPVHHYENNKNGAVTLIGNTWNADIDANILPRRIITMK